jgi:hypothetical protein
VAGKVPPNRSHDAGRYSTDLVRTDRMVAPALDLGKSAVTDCGILELSGFLVKSIFIVQHTTTTTVNHRWDRHLDEDGVLN